MGFASCGRTSRTSAGHHRPKAKRHPAGAGAVFCLLPSLNESKLSTLRQKTKKRSPEDCALLLVVIRLGFEPKTHSLEGCCSIQLSYRTDPYFSCQRVLILKVGANIVVFFEITK